MEEILIEGIGIWRRKKECYSCGNTNTEIVECERCSELFCESCSATYNQFTQIDYNCCDSCGSVNYED